MGHEIVYCSRCQNRLKGADFDKGEAVRLSNYICCIGCLTPAEKASFDKVVKSTSTTTTATRRSSSATGKTLTGSSTAFRSVPQEEPRKRPPMWMLGAGAAGVVVLLVLVVVLMRGSGKPAPGSDPNVPPAPEAKDFRPELDAIKAELSRPLAQHDYRQAQEIFDRARKRHPEPLWIEAMSAVDRDLTDRSRNRLKELKDAALKALERKALEEVRETRVAIAQWGPAFDALLKEFDAAVAGPLAAATAPPEPPKPVVPEPPKNPDPPPAPPPALPKRSEPAQRYLERWEKAMAWATRRDYERAATELRSAAEFSKEDEVRKESAADLKDFEALRNIRAEILKVLAALPAWEAITLELTKEDGSRATVKGRVAKASPKRLELHADPRNVEFEDIAPASLAAIFSQKRGKVSPEETRSLALLCALDGDLSTATQLMAGAPEALSDKALAYAATAREKSTEADAAARAKEWAARKLYYEAEAEFRSMETRGKALDKYERLTGSFADTEFVKRSRSEFSSRSEECRDYSFTAIRMNGKGVFSAQKLQVLNGKEKIETNGWRSREDPAADDSTSSVDVTFYALSGAEYKGWALIGGCCSTTFTWFVQTNELTYVDKKTRKTLVCDPGSNFAAPWDLKLKLSTTHGGKNHAKAEKEPIQWEWVELPLPKYSTSGAKTIRLMPMSKGMAVAAIVVSASNDKRPTPEDTKKLAESSVDEGIPTHALRTGKGEPDLLTQIPEARPYLLVYEMDLAHLKKAVAYDVDNRATITKPFDRIAYLLELQKGSGPIQYVFVSMDAFTDQIGRVGIPDVASGANFRQKVTAMNVHSNVEGLATGINLDGGNIEFWPNNYGPYNGAGIPGATNEAYDFGDAPGDPVDGYGCMQVHNHKAGQTIFSLNKWNAGGSGADLGIGNKPDAKTPDWTFTSNAGGYSFKRLRVLVRPKG